MGVQVIENFFSKNVQNELENLFLNENMQYVLARRTAYGNTYASASLVKESPQFVHSFFDGNTHPPSNFFPTANALALKITEYLGGGYALIRCKANINVNDFSFSKENYYTPHTDNNVKNGLTAIYYVIDSDGATLFFDRDLNITDRVTPKKGTLLIFNNNILHAGQPPFDYPVRCVINFNFRPLEN